MITYLLEKLDKIKNERALYCSRIEETRIEETRIEETRIEDTKNKEDTQKRIQGITIYDFICKNTRPN